VGFRRRAAFVDSAVPFLINNSGRLSAEVAEVFLSTASNAHHCRRISASWRSRRPGLFARYLLDNFRALCDTHGKDYYDRLTYIVTDCSERTVQQWAERELFAGHSAQVITTAFDPVVEDQCRVAIGPLRAVICNYVLDVMPATVVREGQSGLEELCVQTYVRAFRVSLRAIRRARHRKSPRWLRVEPRMTCANYGSYFHCSNSLRRSGHCGQRRRRPLRDALAGGRWECKDAG